MTRVLDNILKMRGQREAGFTLIEVLVAMFIFALISVGTMTALTTTLRGKAQIDTRLERIEAIDMARAIIRADLQSLVLRPQRDALGGVETYVMEGGTTGVLLTFTRKGRPNPGGLEPRSGLERVSYIFENETLIRRTTQRLNPAQNTGVIDQVLLSGVKLVRADFTAGDVTQAQLLVRPQSPDPLPDIFSVTLEFENGGTLVQNFALRA